MYGRSSFLNACYREPFSFLNSEAVVKWIQPLLDTTLLDTILLYKCLVNVIQHP